MTGQLTTPTLPAPKLVRRKRASATEGPINWKVTVFLGVASLVILLPLYFAVVMALKSPAQSGTGTGFGIPTSWHFENFKTAWDLTKAPTAFAMSLFITVVSVVGEIALSSVAAWAIVRNWHRRLFRYSFFYLLAAMFIPFPVIALPQIKLTSAISLDNPVGVAILHILFGLSFNVLLYAAYIRSIPEELEESARMDGCTTLQAFRKVVLPLLAPMNATVGIFAFLQSWNDFMMPSLITSNPKWQTLPVVQNIFQNQLTVNFNVAFASYLLAMVPAILGYVLAQRWIIAGVLRGAIK